jgi:disulfide bond formation protein DsbB
LLVLVVAHVSVLGLYLPPVFNEPPLTPPQTIISLPVQTAVWSNRAAGALLVLVVVHVSVLGLYLPPVFKGPLLVSPPQMIISLPLHTAVWLRRAAGALVLVVLVAVQLSALGLYLPPVSKKEELLSNPPHTIISLSVQIAV